ncbi:MAG: hypothetical protein HKN93_10440, partial [Acidimicrobiia bacterium]|nr:hypothetical protein [Acidimicrobiia bacterium]
LVERIIASSVLADDLAEAIGRRAPVVYGTTGPGALAASRWKTQINENAKRPAFAQELPEANHNDLQGWYGPDGGNGFTAVMLQDDHADSRLLARLAQTESVMSSRVPIAGTVRSAGVSALSRFFTLAVVGDLVSVALAEAAQVDPMPVTALESFKRSLMATAPLDGKETP